jgi:hypothetical protein
MTYAMPTLEPRQMGIFSEWYVLVTWPSGHTDRVQSFKNEAHARGWIEHESAGWIADKRGPRT